MPACQLFVGGNRSNIRRDMDEPPPSQQAIVHSAVCALNALAHHNDAHFVFSTLNSPRASVCRHVVSSSCSWMQWSSNSDILSRPYVVTLARSSIQMILTRFVGFANECAMWITFSFQENEWRCQDFDLERQTQRPSRSKLHCRCDSRYNRRGYHHLLH
jgi:hypothetical protein